MARITAKQKSARRLNIAVARKAKKKSSNSWTPEKIAQAKKNIQKAHQIKMKKLAGSDKAKANSLGISTRNLRGIRNIIKGRM